MIKVVYHQDSGGSWFAVKLADIKPFELQLSPYSYTHEDTVYLDEEYDAEQFFEKIDRSTLVVSYAEFEEVSVIRDYQTFEV